MAATNYKDKDNCPWWCANRHEGCLREMALRDDVVDTRLDGMDKAIILYSDKMEQRLEGLNELRSDYVKDRDQFIQRGIFDSKIDAIMSLIFNLDKRTTVMETRSVVWTTAIGLAFLIVQVLFFYLKKL